MPKKPEGELVCCKCGDICQNEAGKIVKGFRIDPNDGSIKCISCRKKENGTRVIEVLPDNQKPVRKPSKDNIIPL